MRRVITLAASATIIAAAGAGVAVALPGQAATTRGHGDPNVQALQAAIMTGQPIVIRGITYVANPQAAAKGRLRRCEEADTSAAERGINPQLGQTTPAIRKWCGNFPSENQAMVADRWTIGMLRLFNR